MPYIISNARFEVPPSLFLEDYSLNQALEHIYNIPSISHIIIIAEAHFKGGFFQNLDGLTLLKHLLLDKEKNFYDIQVTLLHICPYEYLLHKDLDNFIIMAPNISAYRWKSEWLDRLPDFPKIETSKHSYSAFKKYVLYSIKDKQTSEHDARNEMGAKRLLNEWNGLFSFSSLPLHAKKQIFLEDINYSPFEDKQKKSFLKATKNINKILVIEDQWNKWKPFFEEAFPESEFTVFQDVTSTIEYLNEKKDTIQGIYDSFLNNRVTNIVDFLNFDSDIQGIGTKQDVVFKSYEFLEKLNEAWPFDILFCDLRLSKDSENYDGLDVISKIKDINHHIPIIAFSASRRSKIAQKIRDLGINDIYIKGVEGLSNFSYLIKNNRLDQKYKERDFQWLINVCNNACEYLNKQNEQNLFFYYLNINEYGWEFKKFDPDSIFKLKMILITLTEALKDSKEFWKHENYLKGQGLSYDLAVMLQKFNLLFSMSEFKINDDENNHWIKMKTKFEYLKEERRFRELRNSIFHPHYHKMIRADYINKKYFFHFIEDFLNWLINPLQIDEVREILEKKI